MTTILLVDDDPNLRELARVLLTYEGFVIHEAGDGVEALSALERRKVDLVILDIMMPNLDGWEVCRQLRRYYDFPILMLTARGETSQKLKGFQVGTDDYLVKPFEPLELVASCRARNSSCYSNSRALQGGPSRATSSSKTSGATTLPGTSAPWMCTSIGYANGSPKTAIPSTYRPYAVWGTVWR